MKKNGYTIIELLVIVILLGVASFITIRGVSHALVDNKEELYQDDVHSILDSAKLYGMDNLEELKSNHSIIVTVQDLIDKSYLGSDEEGNFIDVRTNGATLNNIKIAIIYDEKSDSINAELEK